MINKSLQNNLYNIEPKLFIMTLVPIFTSIKYIFHDFLCKYLNNTATLFMREKRRELKQTGPS